MTTVLFAEDEATVRALLMRALEQRGYQVLSAEDGLEAVALFHERASDIDIAVLDVRMPSLGGPAALAQMRALRPDLPAILMSGFAPPGPELEELLRQGVRFVPKPVRPSVLIAMLAELARRAP